MELIVRRRRGLLAGAAVLFTAALAVSVSQAADLRVASSGGFAAAWRVLAPAYERSSGNTVTALWGPSMGNTPEAIPQRLKNAEPIDVVIMVDAATDDLARAGLVDGASKRVLARSLIAVAVKSGAPHPDISSADALRQTLLVAKSIAFSDSASGVYLSAKLFPRLGVWEAIKDKSRMIPAEPVGQVVARGEAELGFQQLSELKPIEGIEIVGLLPDTVQQVTLYSAAIVPSTKNAAAALSLIRFLASPEAGDAIRRSGLDPINAAAR
jgi:molybdate transport system substrate-binding protein